MLNIVVFAEAASDAEIVCGLADRVFEAVGHIHREELAMYRSWCGYERHESFIKKSNISLLSASLKQGNKRPFALGYKENPNVKRRGSVFAFWRKAVQLVVEVAKAHSVSGVLIHCDIDNEHEQPDDIRAAFASDTPFWALVLATPNREVEAWLLNGFIPANRKEEKLLTEWKRKIGFDPCTKAERARDTSGDRDPKNIINALTNGDANRKRYCWEEENFKTLQQRGVETHLTQFLDDVETRFLRLLSNKELLA